MHLGGILAESLSSERITAESIFAVCQLQEQRKIYPFFFICNTHQSIICSGVSNFVVARAEVPLRPYREYRFSNIPVIMLTIALSRFLPGKAFFYGHPAVDSISK